MIINFKSYESLKPFNENIKIGDIYIILAAGPSFPTLNNKTYFIYYNNGIFIDLKFNFHYFLDVYNNKGKYYTLENYYKIDPNVIKNIFITIKNNNIINSVATHEIYKNWLDRIPDLNILTKSDDFNL